jgi:hypothetical protein
MLSGTAKITNAAINVNAIRSSIIIQTTLP